MRTLAALVIVLSTTVSVQAQKAQAAAPLVTFEYPCDAPPDLSTDQATILKLVHDRLQLMERKADIDCLSGAYRKGEPSVYFPVSELLLPAREARTVHAIVTFSYLRKVTYDIVTVNKARYYRVALAFISNGESP